MDVKNPISLDKDGRVANASMPRPVIRTMKKDIAMLEKRGSVKAPIPDRDPDQGLGKEPLPEKKMAAPRVEPVKPKPEVRESAPPSDLPIVGMPEKPAPVKPVPEKPAPVAPKPGQPLDVIKEIDKGERIRKEMEIKQRIEETRKKLEQERIKAKAAQRQVEEKKIKRVEEKIKPTRPKELERPEPTEEELDWKFILAGLTVILIIGAGGFFYWKYYAKEPPVPLTHSECQDYQCLEVEGEGEDTCLTAQDCLPPKPILPIALLSVSETKDVEINKGEEATFFNELKTFQEGEQTKGTFRRILAKLVDDPKEEYFDLDKFISSLNLKMPLNISQSIVKDDINGENYTLFSYGQEQGNRLGLVVKLKKGLDISGELRSWEQTIKDDLKPLLLVITLPETDTTDFQDNVHQEVNIRYLNFPTSDLSIDYAVVNNNLVIATSKESMFKTIDNLLSYQISTSTPNQ